MGPKSAPNTETNYKHELLDNIVVSAPFLIFCAFLFLAPIIPDVKLTRPKLFLTKTCLYGILFLLAAGSLYFGRLKFRKSLFNIPILTYAASVAVFYIFSPDKPVALSELKRSLLSLTAYLAAANVLDTIKKRDTALGFLLSGSSIAILYGIMQRYGGLWRIQVPQFGRVISTFGNPIFFAAYAVIVLPMALGMFFYSKNFFSKLLLCCFLTAGLIAVYFTQTRAAFIAIGVSAAVFIILSIKSAIKKGTFIAALILALAVFTFATKNIWSRQQAHTLIWRDTLTMWAQQPFFGTGPGTFHIYFPQYASKELRAIWPQEQSIINDAHNEYIQYLAETGIVGFGIFLWMIIALFKNAAALRIKSTGQSENYLISGFIASAAGILAQNMFSVDMRFIISSVYLFITAGFIESFGDNFYLKENLAKPLRVVGVVACAVLAVLTFQKVLEPYAAQRKVAATPDFFDEKILEPAKTLADLEALAAKYPGQASIFEKLGWLYSKEKDWPHAVENFVRSSQT